MPLVNTDKALGPNRAWQVEGSVGTQYTVIEWKDRIFCSSIRLGPRRPSKRASSAITARNGGVPL
jgi:hypothetical protein